MLALLLSSCGYQPLHEVVAGPLGGVSVVLGPVGVADGLVAEATVAGAKQTLAGMGLLGQGGYPRMVVEVERLDEGSSGVVAGSGQPQARGSRLTLSGRARLEPEAGKPASVETGEVRVSGPFAVEADARLDTWRRDDAARDLGFRLGRALAERIVGSPAPGDEGMWYRPSP